MNKKRQLLKNMIKKSLFPMFLKCYYHLHQSYILKQTWCLSVCVFVTNIRGLRLGQWDERSLRTFVRPSIRLPFFLSFFLSFCLFVHPFVSLSVHLSFFPSLTSPSSLASFSVSLIYIFLRAAT